jgi:hypothetical protein
MSTCASPAQNGDPHGTVIPVEKYRLVPVKKSAEREINGFFTLRPFFSGSMTGF